MASCRLSFRLVSSIVVTVLLAAAGSAVAQDQDSQLVLETRELYTGIEQARADLDEFQQQMEQLHGEEKTLLQRRRMRLMIDTLGQLDRFVANILELEDRGVNAAEFRQPGEDLLEFIAPAARTRIEEFQANLTDLGRQLDAASGEEQIKLEAKIADDNDTLDVFLEAALNNVKRMELLGLDAAAERNYLAQTLTDRAATAAERVELSLEQIAQTQGRLKDTPDNNELRTQLTAAEAKRDRATDNLSTTISMMAELDLETAEYKQLMIRATGQITSDILDTKVAFSLIQGWLDQLRTSLVQQGPRWFFKILLFLLILFVFRIAARLVRRVVRKAVTTSKLNLSQLLQNMFVSTSGNVVMLIGTLVALSQMGFALGPILAGLGIAGFIVGFALQETLGNFAAGMMILVYRPFDVGDVVEVAGVFGKVGAMSMVSTTVLTLDNQTLVVPNGKIWGDVIKNVTSQTIRRVDMVFGIGYSDDIPHAETVLSDIIRLHPKVLKDPEPIVKLHNLGDSSVDFIVRPWVNTDDYWDVWWDVTREVKLRFDKEGISIPFPQRDVHIYQEKRFTEAS